MKTTIDDHEVTVSARRLVQIEDALQELCNRTAQLHCLLGCVAEQANADPATQDAIYGLDFMAGQAREQAGNLLDALSEIRELLPPEPIPFEQEAAC